MLNQNFVQSNLPFCVDFNFHCSSNGLSERHDLNCVQVSVTQLKSEYILPVDFFWDGGGRGMRGEIEKVFITSGQVKGPKIRVSHLNQESWQVSCQLPNVVCQNYWLPIHRCAYNHLLPVVVCQRSWVPEK
jgi:hypothetical protein